VSDNYKSGITCWMAGDSNKVSGGNMPEVRCQVIACQRSGYRMVSNSRYYPSMQLTSKQINIQAELNSVGGTDSEQCLITKALGEATGMTRLKMRV